MRARTDVEVNMYVHGGVAIAANSRTRYHLSNFDWLHEAYQSSLYSLPSLSIRRFTQNRLICDALRPLRRPQFFRKTPEKKGEKIKNQIDFRYNTVA